VSNEFYTRTSLPSPGGALLSSQIRAEHALIEAAFDKLPTMTGNANYYVAINSSGTKLVAVLAPSGTLPTQSGNAGKQLFTDGTNAYWRLMQKDWEIKSGPYTAAVGDQIMVDTSAGAITITLPASPASTDAPILICDYKGTFGTYNCTVSRNGKNINGSAVDYTADLNFEMRGFVYVDSTVGWRSF
jgi:hypothetical protein